MKTVQIVGEVPVVIREEGSHLGEVVGSAKLEKYPSGYVIAVYDMNHRGADILRRGFSLGSVSISEEDGEKTP